MTVEQYTEQFNKWDAMYQEAVGNMAACASASSDVFIEIAAQHPLVNGLYPGEEFESRLQEGLKRLLEPAKYLGENIHPKHVFLYVPGGRHKKDGVEDTISLSEAGMAWLRAHDCGLHTQLRGGDELNARLTDGRGIFNGEDECDAAVRMFKELGAGRFICICSQGQMMRKALAYIRRGYYPEFVVVPGKHHSPVWEAFYGIPRLIGAGEVMSAEDREARIAGKGEAPLFVYHEYCDDQPYGEQIVKVFRDEDKGREYLSQRVEIVLHRTLEGLKATAGPDDTVDPTHVSVNEGGVCKFFILDGKFPV